ncbi:MAG: DUF5916 domain-containing protein [candidate division Zixibacteria bacterium]|nr:DUF5916 domain-containing protein [candidate division Zixibacteria bacterium]
MRLANECIFVAAIVFLLWPSAAYAGDTPPEPRVAPEITAFRINPEPLVIDGRLDDPIWCKLNIDKARVFTQTAPTEGKTPTESTLVAVAYDDAAVYVAFWCYDSEPDKISGQLVRRDRIAESDRVTIRFDPYHDHQNGNAFQVSAAGVQVDSRHYDNTNSDQSWDGVWESGVSRQPWGWSAEMRIPYSCLRFTEKDEQIWGLQLSRYIHRKAESDVWSFTPVSQGGYVSNFGHLKGLTGIQPAGHTEVLPYAVTREETEPRSIGNPDGRDVFGNAGFDLKYAVASDMVFNAAINPDFGQVELDAPVLNLSTYETFFPERRPFFLEGFDLFQTSFNLFYSRRIGRPPRGSINDPDLLYYKEFPKSTTILGAGKLTGKIFPRTSIAVLTAVTQKEAAEYSAGADYRLDSLWVDGNLTTQHMAQDTITRSGVVEPSATYSVVRVKQEILKNSSIGGMLTLVNQDGFYPAMTGGFDWRLTTNNNAWAVYGQAIFSRVGYKPTAGGFDITFEKTGGKHIHAAVGSTIKDPNLSINRLGYTGRVNERSTWAWFQYRTTDLWWIIRESYSNFNFYPTWNYDGTNIQMGGNYNCYIVFKNYWYFSGSVNVQGEKYSDEETRGNGLWVWPVYPTVSCYTEIGTDSRKFLAIHASQNQGTDRGGTWWSYHVGYDLRPRSNITLSNCLEFSRYNNATRWVLNEGSRSLFADLDQDQFSLEASASYVVNRNLSIQLSAEGLICGLNYEKYRYYLGGEDYSAPVSGYNSDYNYSALNSTFLIRWEYRPGSTIYLVWTRSRPEVDGTANNLDVSRDLNRFFSAGAQNLFLIKASYWMNI